MKQGITAVSILVGSLFLSYVFGLLKSPPPKEEVEKKAYSVAALELTPQTRKAIVRGYGTINPRVQVDIQPQVTGKIVFVSDLLEPGFLVSEGELLYRIDPKDYEIAVEVAKGALAKAKLDYELELGNQIVAKKEWELLRDSDENGRSSLALREPHLKEKRAALEAAEANLSLAKLNLERTELRAPFNALVLDASVEIGQLVPGNSNVTLVSSESFEIEVKVPRDQIAQISNKDQVNARLTKEGHSLNFLSIMGDLDQTGKQAKLLIEVPEPLKKNPPILLNSFVEVTLEGQEISNTISLPATAVREGNLLWVIDDSSELKIINFKELFSNKENVIGIPETTSPLKVITSSIETPLEGMKVKETNR